MYSSIMDKIRIIHTKQIIQQKSTRLKESFMLPTDETLEAKAKFNDFFWCFMHF
ncbi:hypothetical protein MA16_Dca009085 [Dendrobium catenatum]|uniref:Uncharacterized protein n=1 Tax=Dendrobium catenatum TaxID=906689 RepID=A0A2I0VRH2_9ASPA|nr:hypothetical protein MA16_Dca009085 [Dendrobium catenatum]